MTKVKTLTIQFDTPLRRSEIPLFRGAIIAAIPSANLLFHNHDGTALRYAYPLIQYKRIGGKAAIVCIGEGVEAVGELFSSQSQSLMIGKEERIFPVDKVHALQYEVQCWNACFSYSLRDWLPLNEDNYKDFISTDSLIERAKILEKILTGNILSFCKGIGIHITQKIGVTITSMENIREVRYKHIPLSCMDIQFRSNVSLPDFIGLGKHVSVGFGIIKRNYHQQDK